MSGHLTMPFLRPLLTADAGGRWTVHFIEYAPMAHRWLRSMVDFPPELVKQPTQHCFAYLSPTLVSTMLTPTDGSQIAEDLSGGLEEKPSHGKSGDFFYRMRRVDLRGASILLKSVEEDELKIWLKNLGRYLEYMEGCGGRSLLMRVLSLGTMRLAKKVKPGQKPKEFSVHVAMFSNGLLSPHPGREMDETYDLKGHTDGRVVSEDDMARVPSITLKDAAFETESITLGAAARGEVLETVERDLAYLEEMNVNRPGDGVMDYSLLVGLQSVREGEEGSGPAEGKSAWGRCNLVLTETGGARRACISIIDTATRYGASKTVQNALGSLSSLFGSDSTVGGSAAPPDEYAARFRGMCEEKFVDSGA